MSNIVITLNYWLKLHTNVHLFESCPGFLFSNILREDKNACRKYKWKTNKKKKEKEQAPKILSSLYIKMCWCHGWAEILQDWLDSDQVIYKGNGGQTWALRRTCPRGQRCRSLPPAGRRSWGSAMVDGLRGRTRMGWPAEGRTSCWGHGAHLYNKTSHIYLFMDKYLNNPVLYWTLLTLLLTK